jgi:2-iminobutanoate/2-iminopropanoate deaminase
MASQADIQRWPGTDRTAPCAVRAGRFIHVSALGPFDTPEPRAGEDIQAQTRAVLDRLAGVLALAGSSLDRAASVHVYLRRAADFAAMNEVYATYWKVDPPARTTIVAGLAHPDALVEMSAVGLVHGAPRVVVQPAAWVTSPNPYSYGIRSGDTVFLAGLVSRNGRDNTVVKGDVTAQANTVFANARELLEAAGLTLADVVSARVFVTALDALQPLEAVYRTQFPGLPPARATVVCELMNADYRVEVTLVAVAGGGRAVGATEASAPAAQHASPAIETVDRIFLSGVSGVTPQTQDDASAQAREALAAIGRRLGAANLGWAHVTDAAVYVAEASDAARIEGAWRAVFGSGGPARGVLATGLVAAGSRVEIVVNALR